MKLLICMDDTDNLESKGTGHLAEEFRSRFAAEQWGTTKPISRHQLYVHPDVPYTSHNSTMCFSAEINGAFLNTVRKAAADYLAEASAPGSDPGLAVADMSRLEGVDDLIRFGRRAQVEVLGKEEAYSLAERTGVYLSEHGGTGGGVIGALAGIGLRLSGSDGRIRGKLKDLVPGERQTVGQLMAHHAIDSILSVDPGKLPGERTPERLNQYLEEVSVELSSGEEVLLRDKIKCIYRFHRSILLLCRSEGRWTNWTKEDLKVF